MTGELIWCLRYQGRRGIDGSVQLKPKILRTIGRAPGADIVLDDPEISRLHASLETRAEAVWVKDLGSENGTFIDGSRITSNLWKPGQTLRLGAVQFELEKNAGRAPGTGQPNSADGGTLSQEQNSVHGKEVRANSFR